MRLIRITTNYFSYLNQFYSQHPELPTKSYTQQYQILVGDSFGWADFWTHALRKLDYEVWEIVGNTELIQQTWAKENGVSYQDKTWLTEIIIAQVKQFKPVVLFVDDYLSYTAKFLQELRKECPYIKLVLGWCGAPYNDKSVFNNYDIILSNIPNFVQNFRSEGHHSEYMCHAFEARILDRLNSNDKLKVPFSFIGSISKGKGFHNQREKLLKQLIESTNLQVWADTPQPSIKDKLLLPIKQNIYHIIQAIQSIPRIKSILTSIPNVNKYINMDKPPDLSNYVDVSIASRSHPPLFGLAMYQKLYESQITFNNHIDVAAQYASNMRLYEATGVGTCLLTDWQPNLQEVFELDREVVTYRSAEEAIEKVQYLLTHEQERKKIAKAGQARTLKDHTFAQRAIQLDEIIKKALLT
jgi:spore maturation protein CgeB